MPRPLSDLEIADFREKLADAAAGLVENLGHTDFTIRQIADEMRVSAMTPYRYFKDKNDIIAALRTRAFNKFSETLEKAFDAPGNAATKANAAGEAYIRFALEDPISYKLMFDLNQAESEYPELDAAAHRARKALTRHVHPLIEAGILEGDPEIIGHVFWAVLHGAIMLELSGKIDPACDMRTILNAAFTALTIGFAAKTAPA
jgi:AcrR family transcriptional regulator